MASGRLAVGKGCSQKEGSKAECRCGGLAARAELRDLGEIGKSISVPGVGGKGNFGGDWSRLVEIAGDCWRFLGGRSPLISTNLHRLRSPPAAPGAGRGAGKAISV